MATHGNFSEFTHESDNLTNYTEKTATVFLGQRCG